MSELEWNRALSMMALTSDVGVFMPAFELQEDILTIIVTCISQNVANSNKLSYNLLSNKIFVSDCRLFPDI